MSNFNNYGVYRAFNFVQFVEHWMEEKQITIVCRYKIILITVCDGYFDLYIFSGLINKWNNLFYNHKLYFDNNLIVSIFLI